MDNICSGEDTLFVAECHWDLSRPCLCVSAWSWSFSSYCVPHILSGKHQRSYVGMCVPVSAGINPMLIVSTMGTENGICNTVTSQATIHYLVCLKVISSFETQGKKGSWIKDPYSIYRTATPTNNVVARGAAWERLAMASFNDYELKFKKKNHWELANTFHWIIPDFPGRTDKKKWKMEERYN